MKGELLPCPFCGKHAEIAFAYELGHWDIYEVECADCGYSIEGPTGGEGDKAKAATIERWNTRAPSDLTAQLDKAREALRAVRGEVAATYGYEPNDSVKIKLGMIDGYCRACLPATSGDGA